MKKRKSLSPWFRRTGAWKWAKRHRFTEAAFEPYAKTIGQLLLAWNNLHEHLSFLFVLAMGGGWVDLPLAIWHKARTDYSKRQLLLAAIEKQTPNITAQWPRLVDEVIWIIKTADKLEGFRDDSAHTPLRVSEVNDLLEAPNILSADNIYATRAMRVFPETVFQNPRALRLDQHDKDMLIEYRYARERILALRDYTIAIDVAWSRELPWPDRPDLPERKPTRRSKGRAVRRKKK